MVSEDSRPTLAYSYKICPPTSRLLMCSFYICDGPEHDVEQPSETDYHHVGDFLVEFTCRISHAN